IRDRNVTGVQTCALPISKFVKCKNCGNYFVPVGRSDSVYCGYPSPQDKTKECREVGANATRAKKMKNDVLTQEYRRLYMRLKMEIGRASCRGREESGGVT